MRLAILMLEVALKTEKNENIDQGNSANQKLKNKNKNKQKEIKKNEVKIERKRKL